MSAVEGLWFAEPRGPFTAGVVADAIAHANAESPRESCGLVAAGRYVPMVNIADDPERHFAFDPMAYAGHLQTGLVEGVIHSHPGGPSWPSEADMRAQIAGDLPWAIVLPGEPGALACAWGLPNPPIFLGDGQIAPRRFRHGVADCYAFARDWYRETFGIDLPDFARGWDWWTRGDDLYLRNLRSAGFEVVSTDPTRFARELRRGDALLRSISGFAVDHAAMYIGDNLIVEHCFKQLARRRPVGPSLRLSTHLVRHRDLA